MRFPPAEIGDRFGRWLEDDRVGVALVTATAVVVWPFHNFWTREPLWVAGVALAMVGITLTRFAWAWNALPPRLHKQAFLCSRCLQFACNTCKKGVGPYSEASGSRCSHCGTVVFFAGQPISELVSACCKHCFYTIDHTTCREPVRVLGTLTADDLEALRAAYKAPIEKAQGVRFFSVAQGESRVYVLNLADLANIGELLPLTHAARAIEAVWLSGSAAGGLAQGQAIDRFLRRTGLTKTRCRTIKVYSGDGPLPPAAHRLLDTRFKLVQSGVPAASFVGHATSSPPTGIAFPSM